MTLKLAIFSDSSRLYSRPISVLYDPTSGSLTLLFNARVLGVLS